MSAILTIEDFQLAAKRHIHSDSYPSNCVVQENALLGETLSFLALLTFCNHFGIVVDYHCDG